MSLFTLVKKVIGIKTKTNDSIFGDVDNFHNNISLTNISPDNLIDTLPRSLYNAIKTYITIDDLRNPILSTKLIELLIKGSNNINYQYSDEDVDSLIRVIDIIHSKNKKIIKPPPPPPPIPPKYQLPPDIPPKYRQAPTKPLPSLPPKILINTLSSNLLDEIRKGRSIVKLNHIESNIQNEQNDNTLSSNLLDDIRKGRSIVKLKHVEPETQKDVKINANAGNSLAESLIKRLANRRKAIEGNNDDY
jgi:hypothetical protein